METYVVSYIPPQATDEPHAGECMEWLGVDDIDAFKLSKIKENPDMRRGHGLQGRLSMEPHHRGFDFDLNWH